MVAVETQPTFKAETPRILFEGFHTPAYMGLGTNYDISPDGQHFVMVESSGFENEIHVVLNWFEELKRLVPIDN